MRAAHVLVVMLILLVRNSDRAGKQNSLENHDGDPEKGDVAGKVHAGANLDSWRKLMFHCK